MSENWEGECLALHIHFVGTRVFAESDYLFYFDWGVALFRVMKCFFPSHSLCIVSGVVA